MNSIINNHLLRIINIPISELSKKTEIYNNKELKEMAILFGVDISRISRHIKNALNEEEIYSQRNLRKTQIANSDKLVYLYDLDVIISVGYRVKLIKGI